MDSINYLGWELGVEFEIAVTDGGIDNYNNANFYLHIIIFKSEQ